MHFNTFLLVSALALIDIAAPEPHGLGDGVPALDAMVVKARAADNPVEKCLSDPRFNRTLNELSAGVPKTPPALSSYIRSQQRGSTTWGPCTRTIPGSLSSEYLSQVTAINSYEPTLLSLLSALSTICPAYVSRFKVVETNCSAITVVWVDGAGSSTAATTRNLYTTDATATATSAAANTLPTPTGPAATSTGVTGAPTSPGHRLAPAGPAAAMVGLLALLRNSW